jgi:hypothetical protein
MSDKPTKSKVQEKILSGLECDSNRTWAHMIIDRIDMYFPDLFAPEPDPMEEFIADACQECPSRRYCEKGILKSCPGKRDTLRAYVADLHKQIDSLQNMQQLKGGDK